MVLTQSQKKAYLSWDNILPSFIMMASKTMQKYYERWTLDWLTLKHELATPELTNVTFSPWGNET